MKKEKPLTINDLMKHEIAAELGLMDKVDEVGWRGLTAKESGRIGGILAKRKRDRIITTPDGSECVAKTPKATQ